MRSDLYADRKASPVPELAMAYRVPFLFRVMDHVNGLPPRAERKLLGIAFHDQPGDVQYVVKPHPTDPAGLEVCNSVLEGVVSHSDVGVGRDVGTTGLIGRASGHEIDKLAIAVAGNVTNLVQAGFPDLLLPGFVEKDTTPAGIVWIAEGLNHGADITFYRSPDPPGDDPGRGFVFSTGSINFGQSMLVDTRLKRMVANVLLPAWDNDLDDDGDGLYDAADPGCAASTDTSERSATLPCDDGADNDDDGAPGTDFDAGVSTLGPGGADPNGPDPECLGKPWRNKEAPGSCGLGAELILLLAAGPRRWQRSRRAARSQPAA